jgi:hypothetical protein
MELKEIESKLVVAIDEKQCTIQMNKKATNPNLWLSWSGAKPYKY